MTKKAQITMFIIIAIILVAAVALVFVLSDKIKPLDNISPTKDPQGYIQNCERLAVEEAEAKLIPHGGFINVEKSNNIRFNSTDAIWMCYTPDLEKICTNKHPMLSKEIENEIINYAKPKIEECFKNLQQDLSKYEYKQEPTMNFTVNILPNQIAIKLSREISFTKNDQDISINNFNTLVDSPLYDFVSITLKISNEEVSCNCGEETCNADLFKLMSVSPNFLIKRFVSGKNEKVYTITERLSGKTFNFGVRNCVILP